MMRLKVEEFSCIKYLDIEVGPLTVIIGPQASGKSLVSKLIYFFNQKISSIPFLAEKGQTFKSYLKKVSDEFFEDFPVATWGDSMFSVNFESGPFRYTLDRKFHNGKPSNKIEVKASDEVAKTHQRYATAVRRISRQNSEEEDAEFSHSFEFWELRRKIQKSLIEEHKLDFIDTQFFIPAGRSFFANLGKAFAMLEYGSNLDPITKTFGRRFVTLLEGRPIFVSSSDRTSVRTRELIKSQRSAMEAILGAKIKLQSNIKFIETHDGRQIPLSFMSSGQQELLPLLLTLQDYAVRNYTDRDQSGSLLYIEEPEAHLFPSSQSALTGHIVSVSNITQHRSIFIITTHSPYVLSTLNNLILAFQVGVGDAKEGVAKIVPQARWLDPKRVRAYAIHEGRSRSIQDDSGLIDGLYLDKISSEISSVFDSILEVDSLSRRGAK